MWSRIGNSAARDRISNPYQSPIAVPPSAGARRPQGRLRRYGGIAMYAVGLLCHGFASIFVVLLIEFPVASLGPICLRLGQYQRFS